MKLGGRWIPPLTFAVVGLLNPRPLVAQCPSAWGDEFAYPSLLPDSPVRAVLSSDFDGESALYIGGSLSVLANRIARWNGANWSELGPGLNGTVLALAVFDDGMGPALYAGGEFTFAGQLAVNHVARWDGSQWFALGDGVDQLVRALAVFDDGNGPALYAGGSFTSASGTPTSYIARWNGTTWSSVGSGMNNQVHALRVFDDGGGSSLFAGGAFDMAGGVAASFVAKWDGSTWAPLGVGVNNTVRALTVFDDGTGNSLYVGGSFTNSGGIVTLNRIGEWDGASWSALGSGFDQPVDALSAFDDGSGEALFAGGEFFQAGPAATERIAKWDGAAWSSLGNPFDNAVHALGVYNDGGGDLLVAGGSFNSFSRLALWDGEVWRTARPHGMNGVINRLEILDAGDGPHVYAAGQFTAAGPLLSQSLAKWSGHRWRYLDDALSSGGAVNDLAAFDDGQGPALYAAGFFGTIGGVSAANIAKWDGSDWSPLGGGTNVAVNAIEVFDDGTGPALYAACDFFIAGGIPVNRIARWNGMEWTPLVELGGGVGGGTVNDLAVLMSGPGAGLYVGGQFTSAGQQAISYIVKWDGASWTALGSGVDGPVTRLDVLDAGDAEALYVHGTFLNAAGMTAKKIAKWNGVVWDTLGGGLGNGVIYDTAVFDSGSGPALFATGSFTQIGGSPINRIAKWNGTSWTGLGPIGLNNDGNALAAFDDQCSGPSLYVGGAFTEAGGLAARRVARWDGAQWHVLWLGMEGGAGVAEVNDLAVFDGPNGAALYAGGNFLLAGGVPSLYIARWDTCLCATGDFDHDGSLTFADVGPFVTAVLGRTDMTADMNQDGSVDGMDIQWMVHALICACPCTMETDCAMGENCENGFCVPIPEDTTPPMIMCPGDFVLDCADTVPACNPADATATDDTDTDVAITCEQGPLVGDPCSGTVTNTYTATDQSNNSAMCTQVVTIADTPPLDPPEWNPAFDTTGLGALSSVWGSGPNDVFVVGGTVSQTEIYHYDGADWQEMNVPTGALALVWVFGFAPNDVYAVGLAGTVLHYDGVTWTAKNSGSFQNLWGVWGSSPTDIWIVGDGPAFGDPSPLILHHDGNTTFTPHLLPYPAENDRNARSIFKVWGIGGRVFAVGDLGLIVEYNTGAGWTQIESGASQKIVSLWGTSETNIVAVGGLTGGAQFSEYAGGDAWTSVSLPAFGGLNGVFMDNPGEAIIGGFVTAAGPGYVGRYDLASNTPTVELATIPQVIHAIWGDGQGRYYAVGGNFAFPFSGGQCWVRTYGDPGFTPQPPLPPPP